MNTTESIRGTRVVAAEAMWREPLKWDKAAKAKGERHRVFCASLADVFEDWRGPMVDAKGTELSWDGINPVTMDHVRARLFTLIGETPNLDWLLLTKRPQNVLRMAHDAWCLPVPGHVSQNAGDGRHWHFPRNLWLGTSVENQAGADERHPHLKATPAALDFWSAEPLLGPIDALPLWEKYGKPAWVIVGGESGPGARPMQIEWARSLVSQCKAAGVACFVKQLGSNPEDPAGFQAAAKEWEGIWGFPPGLPNQIAECTWKPADKKGGDPEEWPADLRVREFPA